MDIGFQVLTVEADSWVVGDSSVARNKELLWQGGEGWALMNKAIRRWGRSSRPKQIPTTRDRPIWNKGVFSAEKKHSSNLRNVFLSLLPISKLSLTASASAPKSFSLSAQLNVGAIFLGGRYWHSGWAGQIGLTQIEKQKQKDKVTLKIVFLFCYYKREIGQIWRSSRWETNVRYNYTLAVLIYQGQNYPWLLV